MRAADIAAAALDGLVVQEFVYATSRSRERDLTISIADATQDAMTPPLIPHDHS
jgi:hypothetical protein